MVREVTVADGALRLTVEHGEEALPVLLRTLDGAGITMSAISLSRPTLDDVFLTLTGRSLRDDSPGGAGDDDNGRRARARGRGHGAGGQRPAPRARSNGTCHSSRTRCSSSAASSG